MMTFFKRANLRNISRIMGIALLTAASPSFAANVTISLEGVQPSAQKIYISLQTREEFLQPKGSYGEIITIPAGGQKDVTLTNIKPGEYSVSVWHDSDGDGQFTMAPNGMPADGWAMYKGDALRAMPTWDAVKFTVTDAGTKIAVKMLYPLSAK
jgi:uncharacterized protein (DUF2141 family)